MGGDAVLQDTRRTLEICNACRYCEGFCAVFQAIEIRRAFADGEVAYLANLCHGCRACFFACQYAPPHPFAVNAPKSFAASRYETYKSCAWPRPFSVLFRRNGLMFRRERLARRDHRRLGDLDRQFAVAVGEGLGVDLLELDRAAHHSGLPCVVLGIAAEFRHHLPGK